MQSIRYSILIFKYSLYQPMRQRELYNSYCVPRIRLLNNLLPVGINCMETNKKLFHNEFAAVAFNHQLYNLQFPLTQAGLRLECTAIISGKEEAGIVCCRNDGRWYSLFFH